MRFQAAKNTPSPLTGEGWGEGEELNRRGRGNITFCKAIKFDDLVKSLLKRHPGESRGPEHPEITGFRLSPE
jgi:hypothetical protein